MSRRRQMNIKNPALNFIENAKEDLVKRPRLKEHVIEEKEPKRETLSRKLNLLVRPSMYLDLSYIAASKNISINNLVNRILENYIDNS